MSAPKTEVQIHVMADQDIEVRQGDRVLRRFETTIRPAPGLDFLFRLNRVQTRRGEPIYSLYHWDRYYLWALHQEELLNRYCMQYVLYKPVFEYVANGKLRVTACIDSDVSGLRPVFELLGDLETPQRALPAFIRHALQLVLWGALTIMTLTTIKLRHIRLGLFSYDTLWSGGNFDRRLKDVYAHLFSSGIPFVEIFSGFTPEALKNIWTRKRLALYAPPVGLRAKTRCHAEFDLSGFDGLDRKFVERVLPVAESWMERDQRVAPRFARLLKISGLRRIYSIDDTWHTSGLILACRKTGIELVGLAHGYFYQYHQGILQSGIPREFTCGFPKLIVWGEHFKRFLMDRGHSLESDQIIPAGHVRPPSLAPKMGASYESPEKKPFTILYPYEFMADFKQVSRYLSAFVEKGYRVILKTRWDTQLSDQLKSFPKKSLQIVDELDQQTLEEVDVCAGTQSSVLFDMYYLGVPVWYLDTTADYLSQLSEFDLAPRITLEALTRPDFDPWKQIRKPKREIFGPHAVSEFVRPYPSSIDSLCRTQPGDSPRSSS